MYGRTVDGGARSRGLRSGAAVLACALLMVAVAALVGGFGQGRASAAPLAGLESQAATASQGLISSLAVKADGSLWGWGYTLAYEHASDTMNVPLVPGRVGTDSDWATVYCGLADTLAILQKEESQDRDYHQEDQVAGNRQEFGAGLGQGG